MLTAPRGDARAGKEKTGRTAKTDGSAATWAHLGSNQEQPGYEPGALTD
jgi:hypothetical protein